jgi:hypothetical protein
MEVLEMYCKELHVKQNILSAFGGDDLLAKSPFIALPGMQFRQNPFVRFPHSSSSIQPSISSSSQPRLSTSSHRGNNDVDVDSVVTSASATASAQQGRLGLATQDTLTAYLSAWLLEPYIDTEALTIALDLFAFELT